MLNYEVLASSAGDPDGGRLYVLLYNVNTEEVESQVSSVASAGQYSFAFDEVQPAVYAAGSDIDMMALFAAQERPVSWPNLQEPDYLIANQSFVDISMALRFETPILIDSSRVFSVAGETTKLPRQEACKSELAIDYLVGRKPEGCADQSSARILVPSWFFNKATRTARLVVPPKCLGFLPRGHSARCNLSNHSRNLLRFFWLAIIHNRIVYNAGPFVVYLG